MWFGLSIATRSGSKLVKSTTLSARSRPIPLFSMGGSPNPGPPSWGVIGVTTVVDVAVADEDPSDSFRLFAPPPFLPAAASTAKAAFESRRRGVVWPFSPSKGKCRVDSSSSEGSKVLRIGGDGGGVSFNEMLAFDFV